MNLEPIVGQGRRKVSFHSPLAVLADFIVDFHAGSDLLHIAYYLLQHYNGRLAHLYASVLSASRARYSLTYTYRNLLSPFCQQKDIENGHMFKEPAL